MKQVARPNRHYAKTIPDALVVARDPFSFVPPSILLPTLAGTPKHFTFIYLTRSFGNNMLGASIAAIIIQLADDITPQLVKRCIAPKIEAVDFLNGLCACYWFSGVPPVIINNNALPQAIYIPAPFNLIYEMLDDLQNWMLLSKQAGSRDIEVDDTIKNCEKLKRVVLAGQTKLWELAPNYIKIEGTKRYSVLFSNFWIWYEKFLDEYFSM